MLWRCRAIDRVGGVVDLFTSLSMYSQQEKNQIVFVFLNFGAGIFFWKMCSDAWNIAVVSRANRQLSGIGYKHRSKEPQADHVEDMWLMDG